MDSPDDSLAPRPVLGCPRTVWITTRKSMSLLIWKWKDKGLMSYSLRGTEEYLMPLRVLVEMVASKVILEGSLSNGSIWAKF